MQSNILLVQLFCEAKRWGLLDNYDKALKNDNTDPIWQIKKSYLDQINPKEQKATVPLVF